MWKESGQKSGGDKSFRRKPAVGSNKKRDWVRQSRGGPPVFKSVLEKEHSTQAA